MQSSKAMAIKHLLVSDHLHLGERTPVPIGWEAEWAPAQQKVIEMTRGERLTLYMA